MQLDDLALSLGQTNFTAFDLLLAGAGLAMVLLLTTFVFTWRLAASRLAADLIGGRAPELEAGLVAELAPARFG